jgi:hypothetical protein
MKTKQKEKENTFFLCKPAYKKCKLELNTFHPEGGSSRPKYIGLNYTASHHQRPTVRLQK